MHNERNSRHTITPITILGSRLEEVHVMDEIFGISNTQITKYL